MQRFFKAVDLQQDTVSRLVASWLPYRFILSIDRTKWMLGCFTIHFLVVSIGHQGTAFALFWILLAKKGNANTKECIQLIDPFLDVLGSHQIKSLTGDRVVVKCKRTLF